MRGASSPAASPAFHAQVVYNVVNAPDIPAVVLSRVLTASLETTPESVTTLSSAETDSDEFLQERPFKHEP